MFIEIRPFVAVVQAVGMGDQEDQVDQVDQVDEVGAVGEEAVQEAEAEEQAGQDLKCTPALTDIL